DMMQSRHFRFAAGSPILPLDLITLIQDVGAEAFDQGSRSMPNTPPRLIGFTAAATFDENVVNAAPQLLDADVTLIDAEANFPGGHIMVSGLLGEDRVGIRNQGMGAGQIGLVGNQIFYEGVALGSFSG